MLPPAVINWTQMVLSLEDFRLIELRRHGSHALKVTELKTLVYEIDKRLSVYCLNNETSKEQLALFQERFHRPSSNSKKDSWVRYIQNCFFKNRLLGIIVPKDDVIWKALNIIHEEPDGEEEETTDDTDDTQNRHGNDIGSNKKRRILIEKEMQKKKIKVESSLEGASDTASNIALADISSSRISHSENIRSTSAHNSGLTRQALRDSAIRMMGGNHGRDIMNPLSLPHMNNYNGLFPNNNLIGGPMTSQEALLCHQIAASRPQHLNHAFPRDNMAGMMAGGSVFLPNTPSYSSILAANHSRMINGDSYPYPSLPGLPYGQIPNSLGHPSLAMNSHLMRRELANLSTYPNLPSNINPDHPVQGDSQRETKPPVPPKQFPSKLAALAAHRVKIKKEKSENSPSTTSGATESTGSVQSEVDGTLMPKSVLEQYAFNELGLMGFDDPREIMIALRETQRESSSTPKHFTSLAGLVEETMVHIMSQRRKVSEEKKADETSEVPQSQTSEQETNKTKSITEQLIEKSSIEEIIGFEDDGNSGNSSVHFLSSFLLTSTKVKKVFRAMMLFDLSNSARDKVAHLLTLEKKALKWFGKKIPYAYFGIKLPENMSKWPHKEIGHDQMSDLVKKLKNEIDLIEKGMYNLSEQVKGDLGLMLPKAFVTARQEAIQNGLIDDDQSKKVVVVDDESVDLDGLRPEFLG